MKRNVSTALIAIEKANTSAKYERQLELHLGPREIHCEGSVSTVEPRTFDLLVLLVRNRDQAVTKDILLKQLWGGKAVSDAAIARAVMKARRAIHDDRKGRGRICTVNGIGYKFVGPAEVIESTSPKADPRRSDVGHASVVPPSRLSFLPFVNATGHSDLDWIGLGLVSLIANAVESAGVKITPIEETVRALSSIETIRSSASKARHLCELLGSDHVLHAKLSGEPDGYILRHQIFDRNGNETSYGEIYGSQPTIIARELVLNLIRKDAQEEIPGKGAANERLLLEVLARAMAASSEDRWAEAHNLLCVALDLQPSHKFAKLMSLRSLFHLGRTNAFSVGDAMLKDAQLQRDTVLEAKVHALLGQAYLQNYNLGNGVDLARRHLDDALRLAAKHNSEDWIVDVHIARSLIATATRDYSGAHYSLDIAHRLNQRIGNHLRQGVILSRQAIVEALSGNKSSACNLMQQAVQIHLDVQLHARAIFCESILAQILAALGSLDAALSTADRVKSRLARTVDFRVIAFAVVWISVVYGEIRDTSAIEALSPWIESLNQSPLKLLRGAAEVHSANLAVCRGELNVACDTLTKVVEMFLAEKYWSFAQYWMTSLVHLQVRAGQWEMLRSVRDRAARLPRIDNYTELQGMLVHAEIAEQHAFGQSVAEAHLIQAIGQMPAGRWCTLMKLDAAWLAAERGEPLIARKILSGLDIWLDEHPLGLAINARLLFAEGQSIQAVALQQRSINRYKTSAPIEMIDLLQMYTEISVKSFAIGLSRAARLPSTW